MTKHYHKTLLEFTVEMANALEDNSHKTHWRKCSTEYLIGQLERQTHVLRQLAKQYPLSMVIQRKAVNIANFAMMVADVTAMRIKRSERR